MEDLQMCRETPYVITASLRVAWQARRLHASTRRAPDKWNESCH